MTDYLDITHSFISLEERTRLVPLCATITGNSEAAEDLTQETLLEAWRHFEGLRDPTKRSQWLSGIARNVCLRWARKRGRELAHAIPFEAAEQPEEVLDEEAFADNFDLEIELERKELITLLDRALDAVPAETRVALIKHYIDESSLSEIAEQLGIHTSAVAMRLHRGKLVLRRVLTAQMPNELATYGIAAPGRGAWEETRLWCTLCGQRRLLGKLDPDEGSIELMCTGCCRESGVVYSRNHYTALLRGVTGYRRALAKLTTWARTYYRNGLLKGNAPCISCGEPMPVRHLHPGQIPDFYYEGEYWRLYEREQRHGIAFICPACETSCVSLSDSIAQHTTEAQHFLRTHARVRTLPEREIEVAGRPAIVTVFESLTDTTHLDIVSALDTYEPLHIYGGEQ